MRMTEHPVVIVGGGPTGLMLAGELTVAGVEAVVVERRTSQSSTARVRAACPLLHDARPVLLHFDESPAPQSGDVPARVRVVHATRDGA
jgi:2-polyprenyl-6-methoxyphenol hydroxylase-like FAD-dependent oxidoreductase